MSTSRLSHLLHVYFNNTATAIERAELMDLLMQSRNDEEAKAFLENSWMQFKSDKEVLSNREADEILTNIFATEPALQVSGDISNIKKGYFNWYKYAAAAILTLSVAGVYFLSNQSKKTPLVYVPAATNKALQQTIVAGTNKAILTLADGSSIILDSNTNRALIKQGNANVTQINKSMLSYKHDQSGNEQVVYNTLSTPGGGQYQLMLPDGTRVWLNASSSINFPTLFKGAERNVTITGEAYFEVAKNAAMPFKITVKDMAVKVLGTHFNVMAYDDESAIRTTLLEGSVAVSNNKTTKIIVPGEQSSMNAAGNFTISNADEEEVMAWKNGWFQFNGYDIKTVMRQVSRWYNVDVAYEGAIPTGHFTGSVSRNNDIAQVLKIMEAGGVVFKIEGRKITVKS